jgi:single-stranded-DNA-specific exonuclease
MRRILPQPAAKNEGATVCYTRRYRNTASRFMPQIILRDYPQDAALALAASGMPPLLARIYAARGIRHEAQLNTETSRLLPFQQLKNALRMAALLADAIEQNKKLVVVADYDADGATACAVALRGLRACGANVDFIVPNRFEYGYGLTPEIVRLAAQSKPDVLITVDNGIASVEGVAEANRLGMQVLVTDHHLPGDTLPEAACIVNPNQPGCPFPSKHLAGVGVMFYVLLALRAELRGRGAFTGRAEPNLATVLDLVALGTVADVVKLDDNNRILVHQGLQRIRAGRACAGINALLHVGRKSPAQASAYELGFIIGPRLNAAGRLEDMSLGIRCLLTDDAAEAARIAEQLDELNRARREIEADMQQTALAALEQAAADDNFSLALFDNTWHQGVIGILASRLKDKFHRPVVAFARAQEGELKGSGRSIAGLHLRDALDLLSKRHPHLLQKFGGHAMAAGVSIREEHFGEFQRAFEAIVQELLSPADLTRVIETDGVLEPDEFSLETARALERQVWGHGFPQPLFEGRFIVQSQRVVGEKHLKLRLSAPEGAFDAIQFFATDPAPPIIHAVYSLEINDYNGNTSLQLIIRHWEAAEA